MHPAGVKFGLSLDLLQFSGADVIVSDRLLESISAKPRRLLQRGRRLTGDNILDWAINRGLSNLLPHTNAPRKEVIPFFMGLDRVVATTLSRLAQKAGLGQKIGREFMIGSTFWDEYGERLNRFGLTTDRTANRKLFFRECVHSVTSFCTQNDPENVRHAGLIAVFIFSLLDSTGSLAIWEKLRTAGIRSHHN